MLLGGLAINVVIVDDDASIVKLLSVIVKKTENSDPFGFVSPTEALEWCASNEAGLVFVDYQMPILDGVRFIEAFRQLPGKLDVPVVMVTGTVDPELRRRVGALGSVCTEKPIRVDQIRAFITNASQTATSS